MRFYVYIKGSCCLGPTAPLECDNVKLRNPTVAVWRSRLPWAVYKSRLCVVVISGPPHRIAVAFWKIRFLVIWIISFRVTLNITRVVVALAQLEPPVYPREGG